MTGGIGRGGTGAARSGDDVRQRPEREGCQERALFAMGAVQGASPRSTAAARSQAAEPIEPDAIDWLAANWREVGFVLQREPALIYEVSVGGD